MKPQLKRATVYFDPGLHKALGVKASHSRTLAEDAEDLAVFADRGREPSLSFEAVLKDLRRGGGHRRSRAFSAPAGNPVTEIEAIFFAAKCA